MGGLVRVLVLGEDEPPVTPTPPASRGTAWQTAVFAACAVALIAAHAPLIGYRAYANVDEAYAMALGQRINEGFKLYEGAVSQRGPLMYYFFALLAKVFGWSNIVAVRTASLVLAMIHVALVTWVASRFLSRRAGTLVAVVATCALVVGMPALDGMALHAETLQVPVLVGAAASTVLATRARRDRRRHWLVLSGVLYGVAIAIKQSALLQPIASVLWLFAEARRQRVRRLPVPSIALFILGVAAVPLACLGHAAASGTLRSFLYYTLTYNLRIHLRPSEVLLSSASLIPLGDEVVRLTAFVGVTIAIFLATAGFFARRLQRAFVQRSGWVLARAFDLRVYFAIHLLVAVVSGAAMYRFFPHYFVPALPFLTLALAAWTKRAIAGASVARSLGIAGATTLVVAATFVTYLNEKCDGRVAHGPLVQKVAGYVEATTREHSKIFVWGFSSWLYGYSHRRPAGRYVFETYVTGFVPWFHDAIPKEAGRSVPGAMGALLDDLTRESPEVVIDAGSVMIGRPMRAYPAAARWLAAGYCFEVRVGAYDLYRRKAPGADCQSKDMPRPHAPTDFYGALINVPMTALAPGEPALPLCATTNEDAAWFADAPPPPRLDLLGRPQATIEKHRKEGSVYPDEINRVLNCTDR